MYDGDAGFEAERTEYQSLLHYTTYIFFKDGKLTLLDGMLLQQ